jgi:hypothetical protein
MADAGSIPFAWYRPAAYPRLYEISTDKYRLPKTFQEWRKKAQLQFDELRRQGVQVEKVFIDPEALLAWAGGAAIDRDKRAAFAVLIFLNARETRH